MAPKNRVQPTGNGWQVDASAGGGTCFLHVRRDGKLTDMSGAAVVKSDQRIAEDFLRAAGLAQVASTLWN